MAWHHRSVCATTESDLRANRSTGAGGPGRCHLTPSSRTLKHNTHRVLMIPRKTGNQLQGSGLDHSCVAFLKLGFTIGQPTACGPPAYAPPVPSGLDHKTFQQLGFPGKTNRNTYKSHQIQQLRTWRFGGPKHGLWLGATWPPKAPV